jgi:saccharopine dehydrogenase-like NADP-dependent oxidoreductase
LLTQKKVDNVTLALVKISGVSQRQKKEVFWKVFSFAKKGDKLNSMQKITSIVPVIILQLFSKDKIKNKGVIFMEDLGKNKNLFKEILKEIKKEKSFYFSQKAI